MVFDTLWPLYRMSVSFITIVAAALFLYQYVPFCIQFILCVKHGL